MFTARYGLSPFIVYTCRLSRVKAIAEIFLGAAVRLRREVPRS